MKPATLLTILVIPLVIAGSFFVIQPLLIDSNQVTLHAGTGLVNPIGGTDANPEGVSDPRDIIGNVINGVLGITGSLALLVFIFGGFTWVTSAGNEEKVRKGKEMILWAALGLMVIFASYALVRFVIGAVTGDEQGSENQQQEQDLGDIQVI